MESTAFLEDQREEKSPTVQPSVEHVYNIDDNSSDRLTFYGLVGLLEVVGFTCLILVIVWTSHYIGGFAWDGSSKEFNWHPLLMVIGLIFLYGNCKFQPIFIYYSHFPELCFTIVILFWNSILMPHTNY